jgi:hypothetical protein
MEDELTRLYGTVGATAAAVFLTLGLSAATAQTPNPPAKPACFQISDWSGWKISPDAKSMYIRVNISRIYRLDFGAACSAAQFGNPHLITRSRGSSYVCSPLDLDLRVSQGHGMAIPCIVSNMSQLSKEEASALPPKLRP